MRIIAGRFKGRRLAGPVSDDVRPTSDRLRETLFNIIGPSLEVDHVLDGFAGTGALGLEALSRGAARATFVERDRRTAKGVRENVRLCGAENACVIVERDFFSVCGRWKIDAPATFDLVLLDPPYDLQDLDAILGAVAPAVAPGGQVVIEHSKRTISPELSSDLRRTRVVTAGDSALSFFERTSDPIA
jgi:16S rRNA (guanine(966)-N(2))-methyltransferase RsmD